MARAIVYTEFGSPAVLHQLEIPDPVAARGEVVVRLGAAGVNPIDAKLRSRKRPSPEITEPRPVGFDGAGVVETVGEGVEDYAVGDRVAIRDALGTYASALAVPTEKLAKLPDSVTIAEGAALGIPAGTAYQALRSLGVTAGDVLLVHGGSGAVGQAAVQFAVVWGASVVATASPARHDQLLELGATPVAYGDGLLDRVRDAAPSPVTVVLDCAGTDEAIETSLTLVEDRERIATIVRGPDAASFGIRAFSGGSPVPLSDEELALRAEALPKTIELLASGDFTIELGPQLPLADAAQAHELIESGETVGKIILVP
ncbi:MULTISPECIES: NADP-dependent oxidoreductase [unclassified Microbacterium]|uniref:NADP-dependent oxidoreductase n=1 Tax=unclassified Microbacterium TaxID=2609290 RepID=UPI000EAA23C1|nr:MULTISPECIES: NADP-dependent oxidoreductase [unclassified Microbacterium]MBT2486864.1 NADP-dependent oxidoreductase [Microbacterium sp. ISL-108]RKN64783.1 NADP-dependent oxidoreductase [Microbacterium sp. CGR2]